MKKLLTCTIIALLALLAFSVNVNAAEVTTEAELKSALEGTDETITIQDDFEITKTLETNRNVTIDLNGHQIIGPDDGISNWYAFVVKDGIFTLKDTSATQTGELYAKCYGIETKGGTFIMESGKIIATKNGGIGTAIVNYGGKVEIKGGTLIASVYALNAQAYFSDMSVVISGGTLETKSTQYATVQVGGKYSEKTEAITINGGTFKGTNSFEVNYSYSSASVNITGGSFDSDISDYLPENFEVEKDENGNFVVKPKEFAILIEKAENGTITADKEKAIAGEEVTLTVEAAEGYKLKSILVTMDGRSAIEVTDNKFVMPNGDVTVSAEFESTSASVPAEVEKEEKDDTPKTGIETTFTVFAVIAVVSLAGLVLIKRK